MLELVCDQGYGANGVPVDRSPYRNHGRAVDAPGVAGPGGGALSFPMAGSAVALGLGGPARPFAPLVALRVEALVRLPDAAAARYGVVVDGDSAFRLAVDDGAPTVAVLNAGGGLEQVRADPASAPDGRLHPLPLGRWVELVAEHDGAAHLRLFMDGALVAAKVTGPGHVAAVRGRGVTIGNAVGGGMPLGGALARLRLWRHDPAAMRREFLARPMTPELAACWEEIIRRVRAWMAADPAGAAALLDAVRAETDAFLRALRLRPEPAQDRLRHALAEVLAAWFAGEIGGRRMEQAYGAWRAALAEQGFSSALPEVALADPAPWVVRPPPPTLDAGCDPQLLRFLRIMARAAAPGGT
ncbi:LamG-like jellyroll fold domain-containing protein [Roseococcus sp. DSY-14]|uniref:LamG-like jellyroll fold domain-containing protein n=1 Tax=Roseococcus sp. DSY-14 TaxID=3369650 RepID=UPI00387B7870